jgi:hypothetical protein
LKTWTYAPFGSWWVTLQYRVPGSSAWHILTKVHTNTHGLVMATYKVTKKGTYSFRAISSGSTYVAGKTSHIDSVKVS